MNRNKHLQNVIMVDFATRTVVRKHAPRRVEAAPALETWFPCACHSSGCRELVRVPGMCAECRVRLSIARAADVHALKPRLRGKP